MGVPGLGYEELRVGVMSSYSYSIYAILIPNIYIMECYSAPICVHKVFYQI